MANMDQIVQNRIIPADAGSTPSSRYIRSDPGDHPRGCGEHLLPVIGLAARAGSSPRMRGARGQRFGLSSSGRIIPADAGSTPFHSLVIPVCQGSSPRMRGALLLIGVLLTESRIIPADAGSTNHRS